MRRKILKKKLVNLLKLKLKILKLLLKKNKYLLPYRRIKNNIRIYMITNPRTITKLFYNLNYRSKTRFFHANSFFEIKQKIDADLAITKEENTYLKIMMNYTLEQILLRDSFSEIMRLSEKEVGHELHPQSLVTIIEELYNNLSIDEQMILESDNLGFYDSNATLNPNYLEIYEDYIMKLFNLTHPTSKSNSSNSSDTSSDDDTDIDSDINPWDIGIGLFMISGFLILLILTIIKWFKIKVKKTIIEDKKEEEIQNNIFEYFYLDYNLKTKLLLLFIPSFIIIIYSFRYYYYYKLKLNIFKHSRKKH